MKPEGVYRFTSIARPVDPKYPTNRLVLIVAPVAVIAAVVLDLLVLDRGALGVAVSVALSTFGVWALTRELSPDDNAAAFIGLVFALAAQLVFGPFGVLPLFIAVFLSRIVNRSTGCPPRLFDSVSITGLVIWASGQLGDPLLALAATIAFYLDASLAKPARIQFLFGTICLGASMFFVVRDGVEMPALAGLDGLAFWGLIVLLGAYSIVLFSTNRLASAGDIDELPLNVPRVRAGMFVTGLIAAQAPVLPGEASANLLIWCAMAGVVVGAMTQGRDRAPR